MAETKHCELTTTPILHPPALLSIEEVEEWGVELSLEGGRGGGKAFLILFLFLIILLFNWQ